MTDKNFNPTSPFIPGQLPEFVRVDHPTLVSFLTAYYEWLDSDNTYLRSPKKLASVVDVDTTLEEFITYFKNEYLFGFPEKLAVSEKTSKPVDPVKLMKNIKGFYRAKGTEKTYDFLFRILFDTSVEFYYPKNDIMKLSDGKWVVRRSIKISNNIGNAIFDSVGGTVVQRNTNGDIVASARVLEVSTYRIGTNDIAELFLGGVNGQFQAGYDGIEFTDKSGVTRKENRVFSVIGKTTISNGGSGYKAGDRVVFTPATGDTGVKAAGRVAEVDASGTIRKIIIDNFGVNYKTAPTLSVQTELGSGFAGSVTVSGMAEYQGYYANNDGRLSTNKVIQDSHYYQNFSYVILSEVTIDRYRDVLKRLLNPAGLAFFGKVQIKRCAVADLQNSTSLVEYEVPIIGHYAPYTFLTYDDLSNWFTDPNTGLLAGYDPTVHNQIIRNDLDGNGSIDFGDIALSGLEGMSVKEYYDSIGNPVTFNRAFINPLVPLRTANFQNADPFWIVYQHPNRKIRGSVTARIPFDLKNEFLNDLGGLRESPFDGTSQNSGSTGYWAEWTEGSTANRIDWSTGFTSGERYVTLNYNPLKPYTQYYYEPQLPGSFATLQSLAAPNAFLPKLYYENVFTYQGYQNLEKLRTDNSKSLAPNLDGQKNLSSGKNSSEDYYIRDLGGNIIGLDNVKIIGNTPTLSDKDVQINNPELQETLTEQLQFAQTPFNNNENLILQSNKFTSWDAETSSHYLTWCTPGGTCCRDIGNCVGGRQTGYLGVAGLTNTSRAAMNKFVGSLLGNIAGDWNGVSGGNGYRLGKDRYTLDYNNLISMNTESWDPLFASDEGIKNPDDPNSIGNFIVNKIWVPVFSGGTGADGLTFDGLQTIFPNALFGNYGHPGAVPRNIKRYHDYPGFSGDARSSKFETITSGGKTYRSYVPSATCPDCRWDGRESLDSNDPNASKVGGIHLLDHRWGTKYMDHALKIWKDKWRNYCRGVKVWMPSFYITTEDLDIEKTLQNLTIKEMVKWRQEIAAEKGYDDVQIIPFISNKAYTVGTGSGGYSSGRQSLRDGSFFTPQQFVDLYIAPSLSGNPKGSVAGFYLWTGDDTYTKKWGCAITSPNPRMIEVTAADGTVVDWRLNPETVAYGFEPYWDFLGGEAWRPGAPTGPAVIGKNGQPRVAWFVQGGGYGHNPWWGGKRQPSWPTDPNPARLAMITPKTQARSNFLAYQAFLDGMTGQTSAQYVFDKPEKYTYLKNKFPSFFDGNLPEWSCIKEYTFRIRKTSADGTKTVDLGMAPGTTFAFNYRRTNSLSTQGPRYRGSLQVTGGIISNPLFSSLTGTTRVFSYAEPGGTASVYPDLGWNTADRIGYVKRVQNIDANTVEIGVEPYFFVGQPQFTQDVNQDQNVWSPSAPFGQTATPAMPYGKLLVDGATHGFTSGNAYPTCLGATNPVGNQAFLNARELFADPSMANQRPRWVNLGFPGDIISFGGPTGATFELLTNVSVTGNFPRISKPELDAVFALHDKINYLQFEAGLAYWNSLYNPVKTTDFAFEYDAIGDAWYGYGPGDRIIINGWKPEKPGTSPCSSSVLKPNITVTTDDNTGTMEITYTYTNTCTEEKTIEWLDTPPLNLGDSIEYYDSRVYGTTGSGVGIYRTLDRNYPIESARYPDVLYSPVHLVKTKFDGDCCSMNNFAASMSLIEYSPLDYGHDVSLVVSPPQDYPAVTLANTIVDVVTDSNFTSKVTPTQTVGTSKWAAAWSTPTYGNGPTGSTHIVTMARPLGRVSGNAQFAETIPDPTATVNFLSTIPTERRTVQPYFLNTTFADGYWKDRGITLDNTYNTGDACRNSAGNFVSEDVNDPREVGGATSAYDGTQRFISPWFDNATARAKTIWSNWLTSFSSAGGNAAYFVGDNEDSPTVIWSDWLRKETSDPTSRKNVKHMNYILSDPRADSLTAGNAATYGSLKTQLLIGAGYTTSQFSSLGGSDLAVGASGGYKVWNSAMSGLAAYYVDQFFTDPITTLYPTAKISNYDNVRIGKDKVNDLNGHREYYNRSVGNSVAPYLYGEIDVAGTVYEVYSTDPTILNYNPSSPKLFGVTPWNGLLMSQQKLREVDANRIADGKGLQTWIASVKYYESNAFGGNVSLHNEYWRENVFHTMLHNPDVLLYWNSSSTVAADDKYLHDAIDTVNNITNQQIKNTLSISNERLFLNSEFIVSGCASNNKSQNIFRVSVDRSFVNTIDISGTKYNLTPSEVGVWITASPNCSAILKNNYDPVTKTLFLRGNTSQGNAKYKAYQDRYSFQFATYNEGQLYGETDPTQSYWIRGSDVTDTAWLTGRYNYVSGAQ